MGSPFSADPFSPSEPLAESVVLEYNNLLKNMLKPENGTESAIEEASRSQETGQKSNDWGHYGRSINYSCVRGQ